MTAPNDDLERSVPFDDSSHPRGSGAEGGQFVAKDSGSGPMPDQSRKEAVLAKQRRGRAQPRKGAKKTPGRAPTPLDVLAMKAYRDFGSIKEGDSGGNIRDLQELLNGLGLASTDGKKINPNGAFGPATTAAVKALQARLGIAKPNGRVTGSLMRKLQDTALLSPCVARSAVLQIAYEDLIERADGDGEFDAADDLADVNQVEEEPEHTGAMIALIPTVDDADRLAVEGYEPSDELHVTLVYLGDAVDYPADERLAIIDALQILVEDAIRPDYDLPLTAEAFSVAVFNPQSADFDPCIVLGLSGADLEEIHTLVDAAVDETTQVDLPDQHQPYIPHVTLAYTDDTSRLDALFDRTGPVTFDRLRVAFGDEVVDIPLTPDAARSQPHPGQRYRHGWVPVGGLSLLGSSQTQDRLEVMYGGTYDSEEFSPGAFVELSERGDIHIDLAAEEPDHYHVFGDMDQDQADALADDIDWALDAKPGRRTPDPVNGLVDWRDNDGVIVGYTPTGDVRIGWPAGDDEVDVLDLPADEAKVLRQKLWDFARIQVDTGNEVAA